MKAIINTTLSLAISMFMAACGGGTDAKEAAHDHSDHSDHAHDHDHSHDHSAEVKNFKEVLAEYFVLKDALVASNAEEAAAGAAAMHGELDKLEVTLDGHEDHINSIVSNMRNDLEHIAETSDLEHQRAHFETVSDNVYEIVKMTGSQGQTIYRQYCPMAFDDKGAYWLSAEREIRNPYFGDKMLKCGSVQETL